MKEEKKINRIRCEKLKTLKLYQRKKSDNKYNGDERKTDNENKINNTKILFRNNSSQNIFPKMHESMITKKVFSPIINNEEKKESVYEIEKGIPKHPLCLFSKNKYHFGTTRIEKSNFLINEHNNNASTKITEQNNLLSYVNYKKIYQSGRKNDSRKKKSNIIKLKFNKENKSNKMNLYKRYNNGTGMDKHVMSNKSCPNTKSEIEYNSYINNSTKEDIQKLNLNKIKIIKDYNKQSSLSNFDLLNNEKEKNLKRVNSTLNLKAENKNISGLKKEPKKKENQDDGFYKIMSKYHFVMNNYLIPLKSEKNLQEEIKIKNFNKNAFNTLKRENEKLFSHFRSIVPVNKFSEKFRDPLNNSFDRELEENRKMKEKNIINKDILPGIKLLKEMDIEIQKRKIVKKVLKGKPLLHKLKKIIIRNIDYIRRLNITFEELLHKYKRSPIPFHYFKTEELILAIRNKNYDLCCDILNHFKYIVLDFDNFHFTPLHWAVKVNFYQIIPKLMSFGAPINEQNFMGETPLHISAHKNFYESTALLMIYLASPFIKDKNNRRPIDCTKDLQLIFIFKKIMELHSKYLILRQKYFYENVQKDFIDFISVEFSNQLNPEALALITNLK